MLTRHLCLQIDMLVGICKGFLNILTRPTSMHLDIFNVYNLERVASIILLLFVKDLSLSVEKIFWEEFRRDK